MAADQQSKPSGKSTVESVTPQQLHKKQSNCSRNPLKWFKALGDSSASGKSSISSFSKSTAKPPLVVNYFPVANCPGLR